MNSFKRWFVGISASGRGMIASQHKYVTGWTGSPETRSLKALLLAEGWRPGQIAEFLSTNLVGFTFRGDPLWRDADAAAIYAGGVCACEFHNGMSDVEPNYEQATVQWEYPHDERGTWVEGSRGGGGGGVRTWLAADGAVMGWINF